MTVYVDLLFGVNALINYLLLQGSAMLGGCPVKLWRLLSAAALGGAYAAAAVLPGLEYLQRPVFQVLFAGLMLLTAFGWKRNTVKQGLFFFGLSFAFAGVVLVVIQLMEPDCMLLGGRAYYAVSTPALLLLAGLCYGLSAVVLAGCGTHTGGDLVRMTLELDGRTAVIRALRDTGNTLRDPITGQNILIVGNGVREQLLPHCTPGADPAVQLSELSWIYPKLHFRLVPYRTIGVDHGMLPAVRCGLRLKEKKQTVLVAFSPTEVSPEGRFEALWGGDIQ